MCVYVHAHVLTHLASAQMCCAGLESGYILAARHCRRKSGYHFCRVKPTYIPKPFNLKLLNLPSTASSGTGQPTLQHVPKRKAPKPHAGIFTNPTKRPTNNPSRHHALLIPF